MAWYAIPSSTSEDFDREIEVAVGVGKWEEENVREYIPDAEGWREGEADGDGEARIVL